MFGLKDQDIEEIHAVLRQFPEIESALIFGSRAKGNYRNGSDVDIALKGERVTFGMAVHVAGILNEDTLMPYHFDVLDFNSITNAGLSAHINRVGVVFFDTRKPPQGKP
jgi:predicted nucleotidyltransferase